MHPEPTSIVSLAGPAAAALAAHPAGYLLIGALLLLLVTALPLAAYFRRQEAAAPRLILPYAALVALAAVYYRLPFIFLPEQNADESLEIASAATLLHDPVYWRSVDLGTHGPLATYPLMLPRLFGLGIDYGSTRLIGLAMLLTAVLVVFLRFRKVAAPPLAAIAVLPLVTFICLTDYWDFIAYNAEYPVICMLALALYFTDRALAEKSRSPVPLLLAGICTGGTLFVKVQSLPILTGLGASTLLILWCGHEPVQVRLRRTAAYLGGCLLPPLLLAVYLGIFNLGNDFMIRFVQGQLNYTDTPDASANRFAQFFQGLAVVNRATWHYFYLLLGAGLLLAPCCLLRPGQEEHRLEAAPAEKPAERLQLAVLLLITVMSAAAVYIPGRPSRHYFLLIAFPLGVLVGRSFLCAHARLARPLQRHLCVALFVTLTVLGQYVAKLGLSNQGSALLGRSVTFEMLTANAKTFTPPTQAREDAIIAALRRYARPGESMAIWGWANRYYVATGLTIACKTSTEQLISSAYGNTPYYLDSFMHELETAKPPLFLDAVAPRQFRFKDRAQYGFEQFPRIAAYVRDHYRLAEEIEGVRIYVSMQRMGEVAPTNPAGL